jgi:hypothetical protein
MCGVAAQQHEIDVVGRAEVGPVHDVVDLRAAKSFAAGEAAVSVAVPHEPVEPAGDRAAPPANPEGCAVERLGNPLDVGVAGEPTCGVSADVETQVAQGSNGDGGVGPAGYRRVQDDTCTVGIGIARQQL